MDGKAVPIPTTAPVNPNPGALGTYSSQNPYAQGASQQGYNSNPAYSQGQSQGYGQSAGQSQQRQGYSANAQPAASVAGGGQQQQGTGQGFAQPAQGNGQASGQGSGQQGSGIPWDKVLGSAAKAAVNAAAAGRRLLRA